MINSRALPLFLNIVLTGSLLAAETPPEKRVASRRAFSYGLPLVENYSVLYRQAVDRDGKDFVAPFNVIGHAERLATPDDRSPTSPCIDTLDSYLWMDLRTEPLVLTMPAVEKNRYYSAQFVDLYTYNFAYLGSRTSGNEGGKFLIAGPGWKGATPAGINSVIRTETQLAYVIFRTQVLNGAELSQVKEIQKAYTVQPLSKFTGESSPPAAPAIQWPKPVAEMTQTMALFNYLNFILQFCPTHPNEVEFMKEFAQIDVGAGKHFDLESFSLQDRQWIEDGIADAWNTFSVVKGKLETGEINYGDIHGNREFLKKHYAHRLIASKLNLYGLSREEALYIPYFADSDSRLVDASKANYTVRFEKGKLPPAKAFWSLTVYDRKTQRLVANPLDRFQVSSTMQDKLNFAPDGSLTLYLQSKSPEKEKKANWLPTPEGPCYAILRIYQPSEESGGWMKPQIQRVELN